jgi:hypothetical protein
VDYPAREVRRTTGDDRVSGTRTDTIERDDRYQTTADETTMTDIASEMTALETNRMIRAKVVKVVKPSWRSRMYALPLTI